MKISHYLFVFFFIGILTPFFLFAQEAASLIADIQAQIAALQARVRELQLNEFNRDLFRGAEGDDVRALQEFFAKDSEIYPEGLITGYFGILTEKAVQRWQVKEGIVSSGTSETTGYGRIGPKTRARLNELIGKKASASDAAPQEEAVIATPETITPPIAEEQTIISTSTAPSAQSETAPEGAIAKPPANIRSGTGMARTNSVFDFGTGAIHYKELGRLGESGAFYLGRAGGGQTNPPFFVANVASPKGSACDPYDAAALAGAIGPKSICEFTDAANYIFSNKEELVRFHEKSSSCYDGVILFRQNNLYGGIEPEDVTKSGDLSFHYWYDASGGSDFSDVCLLGKRGGSAGLASVLDSLSDILEKIQREIKKLSH